MDHEVKQVIDERIASDVAQLFQALSDPNRVQILTALMDGDVNVGSLAESVGISESAVSHHLRGLRLLRLVRADKQGRQVFYHLDDEHVAELLRSGLDHVIYG